jgi:hypothetical protein
LLPLADDDKKDVDPLEAILRSEITLDTDVKVFALVAGLEYSWHGAYYASSRPDLQAEARARYQRRRAETGCRPSAERRIANAMLSGYGTYFRTLGDLKSFLASERGWRGVGSDNSKAKKRFDDIIAEYGMEPFPFMTKQESRREFDEHLRLLAERKHTEGDL